MQLLYALHSLRKYARYLKSIHPWNIPSSVQFHFKCDSVSIPHPKAAWQPSREPPIACQIVDFSIKDVEEKEWFTKYRPTVRVMECVSALMWVKVSGSPEGNIGGKVHLDLMWCVSSADTNEHQREWFSGQARTVHFKGIISTIHAVHMSPWHPSYIQ